MVSKAWFARGCRMAPVLTLMMLAAAVPFAAAQRLVGPGLDNPDWVTIGHDPGDSRSQPNEHAIGTSTAAALVPRWIAATGGDVSGTPTVANGAVYFGDFTTTSGGLTTGGMVYKLDAATGNVIWSHPMSYYTGIANDIARVSPSLDGNVLIVGSLSRPLMVGINATTGEKMWMTQVNPDKQAAGHGIMTGSPVLVGDTVITGVSASGAGGVNATFRANIVALNALTGELLWSTYAVPDNGGQTGGYAGATMFAPPAVDLSAGPHGLVYGTFGQAYREPDSVAACNASQPNHFFSESCEQAGSYFDSIVALDFKTGAVVWSYRVIGDAAWHHACDGLPAAVTWCLPETDTPLAPVGTPGRNLGDVWDLGGSGPNVFQIDRRDVVGVGEKSGLYIVLDANTGEFVWNTLVGPGGDQGGFEWGTAYDGKRIYVSLTNQHHIPYNLTGNGILTYTVATGGSWAALDPATGKILWQVADPQTESVPGFTNVGVWDLAPVSVANGVVYASSMAKTGNQMYGLDAASGKVLWRFAAGSSVNSGPSIANGSLYWGSGYSRSGVEGSGNKQLFAFTLRPPGNVTCSNQVLTGLVQGNLTVPREAWCDLTNNVHVTGNLQLQQSSGIRLVGATIDGNLQLNQLSGGVVPSSPDINVICGNTIKGNLQVLNGGASAATNIGGGAGCGNTIGGNLQLQGNDAAGNTISGNTINGNLQVLNNTGGGTTVSGNIVGGHIQIQNNAGASTVTGNTANGNLQCQGNGSVTGSGNLAHGNIQGQCTGTRF